GSLPPPHGDAGSRWPARGADADGRRSAHPPPRDRARAIAGLPASLGRLPGPVPPGGSGAIRGLAAPLRLRAAARAGGGVLAPARSRRGRDRMGAGGDADRLPEAARAAGLGALSRALPPIADPAARGFAAVLLHVPAHPPLGSPVARDRRSSPPSRLAGW